MSNAFVTTNTASSTSLWMFREFRTCVSLASVAVPHHRRTPPRERSIPSEPNIKTGISTLDPYATFAARKISKMQTKFLVRNYYL